MNFFQKYSLPIFGTIFALAVVFLFILWSDLSKTRAQLASVQTSVTELDQTVERTQNSIFSLKKEGYVEVDDFGVVAQQIFPSVVFILTASAKVEYNVGNKGLIGTDADLRGTGFFISEDGYIATAKHVIEGLAEKDIEVQDIEGVRYAVESLFLDTKADVGIIKIKTGKKHQPITVGYFQNFEVGDEIGIIGFNPGFNVPLLHKGTISAKGVDENGNKIFTINSFANKGNSGSPVFSLTTGRTLGILSARKSEAQTAKLLDPRQFASGVSLGGVGDPGLLSAELYNETVKIVQEVSQVGIGIVYAVESAFALIPR